MIWNVPNILSLARLVVFLPILWVLAICSEAAWLGVVLAAALATDALDGFWARRFKQVTELGARLDSIADNSLMLSSIIWLLWLRPEVLHDRNGVVLFTAIVMWAIAIAIGWLRFRRFANLHLYSDKVAAIVGGVFLIGSFVSGFHQWLYFLAAGASIVANLEGALLLLTRDQVDEHMGSLFARQDMEVKTPAWRRGLA